MPVGRFKTYQKKGSFGSLFFGLIFFDAAAVASTQNAKVRKATTPLPLRCPFFLQARSAVPGWGILERKVAEVRKATTPLLLQESLFFSRHAAPSAWLQPPPSRCKVAEVRKATTPLLLQQGSDFLIRRCKALRQTSRSQESFSLRGQNEGAEVVGRTKLADRTTFKQI